MTHRFVLTSFAALSLATAGCDQAGNGPAGDAGGNSAGAGDAQTAGDAVKGVEAEMLAAFQAKNADRLASYYASDAVLATPGRTAQGSDAVNKAIGDDMADPAFKLSFTNERTDVAASGDLAWTSGSFQVSFTNPQTKQVENGQGTYVTVFRKQADGSWKVVADVATPREGAPQ